LPIAASTAEATAAAAATDVIHTAQYTAAAATDRQTKTEEVNK